MRKVTALYGDGGTGKTLLAMQLMVASALGMPFLDLEVRQGRVYGLLAENDTEDTHITSARYRPALWRELGRLRRQDEGCAAGRA